MSGQGNGKNAGNEKITWEEFENRCAELEVTKSFTVDLDELDDEKLTKLSKLLQAREIGVIMKPEGNFTISVYRLF